MCNRNLFKICRHIFPTRNLTTSTQHTKQELKEVQLETLPDRSLIKIKGPEINEFLQGLITNDINHLISHSDSMYAMFLNSKGRVIADSILYNLPEENSYLLDLHVDLLQPIQSHLKKYCLRRKIEIINLEKSLQVCSVFVPETSNKCFEKLNGIITVNPNTENDILVYKDPRNFRLGLRVIAPKDINLNKINNKLGVEVPKECLTSFRYKTLRYKLGIGEGPIEIPTEKSFPLEVNCDYLNGISFQKGCYIGQELTARTYHTGVVRKRLMPLIFKSDASHLNLSDHTIFCRGDTKVVGKLRSVDENYGLGLLRIENVLRNNDLIVGDVDAKTIKPSWWPQEPAKTNIQIDEIKSN